MHPNWRGILKIECDVMEVPIVCSITKVMVAWLLAEAVTIGCKGCRISVKKASKSLFVDNAVAEITLRSAKGELLINPITVPKLRLKWKFFAGKDISATSAVANGVVYFPSWNGYIYAVNAFSGRTNMETEPRAVYVGVSSLEVTLPATQCCTFRGSLAKLDVRNGVILWQTYMLPDNGGKLGDFGEAPMLLSIFANGRLRDVVVAVQKSVFAWTLDRDNGDLVWFNLAGPGGKEGGGIWGAATDGKRVYTNIANSDNVRFPLSPCTQTTTGGAWVALDANTGEILWTTANPSNDTSQGPVTLANGVLFAGSVASNGPFYAMDARTGTILWSYTTGATIYGSASASSGCVYIGSGYSVGLARFHPTWTTGTSLFAFCIL
ncbi:hypothetical protein Acr_06g0003600 [Actinidia rufa]|uniref:Pyrrolo-quinoline quinone repeat domain-containing protein n=1 Tax=Actinidia rufa TaxID=165716 RepID=A0A7J0EQ40_9ERIC|nr:hypothetical protein Acr_06g0003600 [Actinidia rufa]